MIGNLRITILAENTARGVDLLGEHGLAFWIEADGRRILFDTVSGRSVLPIARAREPRATCGPSCPTSVSSVRLDRYSASNSDGRILPLSRSLDYEDQYADSCVRIGVLLNGVAGLPGIPMAGGLVSGQLAARIRVSAR